MTKKTKEIIVIGAGPGGLSSAMILANRGYKVTVFEQDTSIGGRNKALHMGEFSFDLGPTFLMMEFFLREMFTLAGRKASDYLDLVKLEPLYRLTYKDKIMDPTTDHENMKIRLAQTFPGNEEGLDKFMRCEETRYIKMYPCLKKDYSSFFRFFSRDFLTALPHLALTKTLYQNLGRYFSDDLCKLSFTFQSKYLGMSPWECPGAFTIIPYIEHAFGIYHIQGGLCKISEAMATILKEHGGKIHTNSKVKTILTDSSRIATGVLLENGERISADAVVINADFGHAMESLFAPGFIKKYTAKKMANMNYSCSTFMLYLGLDTLYQEPHHNIIFAHDYPNNLKDISTGRKLSDDMSIYVRNASITDPNLAPHGQSALYVLVPVPNLRAKNIVWNQELMLQYREKVLNQIIARTSMTDLTSHIVSEKMISPQNWYDNHHIFAGSTFNLSHSLNQMLYFRPRNRFEECKRCYLVGGGTHPGSGLPTIYESARITANLICKEI